MFIATRPCVRPPPPSTKQTGGLLAAPADFHKQHQVALCCMQRMLHSLLWGCNCYTNSQFLICLVAEQQWPGKKQKQSMLLRRLTARVKTKTEHVAEKVDCLRQLLPKVTTIRTRCTTTDKLHRRAGPPLPYTHRLTWTVRHCLDNDFWYSCAADDFVCVVPLSLVVCMSAATPECLWGVLVFVHKYRCATVHWSAAGCRIMCCIQWPPPIACIMKPLRIRYTLLFRAGHI
jgi:hypothetical protein